MKPKHLISLKDYSRDDIEEIFALAEKMKADPASYKQALLGKTLAMIFQKPSTRTRVSFEVGMFQLGGLAVVLNHDEIHLSVGESVADTARVLSTFADGIMARVFAHQDLLDLAKYGSRPVINGLSDLLHRCQALADFFTLREKFGSLQGLKLAYVGDGNNVCHELMIGAARLGVEMIVAIPEGLRAQPAHHQEHGSRCPEGRDGSGEARERSRGRGRRRARRVHRRVDVDGAGRPGGKPESGGKPYSWTFNNDMNGDANGGNDLLYIPRAPGSGDVIFAGATAADRAAAEEQFWKIVNENGLAKYAGRTVERNTSFSPWVSSIDLNVSQEIPTFFKGHKAVFVFDILNFGNLLNKRWGRITEMAFNGNGGQTRSFVNFAGIDSTTGKYVYAVGSPNDFTLRQVRGEPQWALQATIRYEV